MERQRWQPLPAFSPSPEKRARVRKLTCHWSLVSRHLSPVTRHWSLVTGLALALLTACASTPPHATGTPSSALADPTQTPLWQRFDAQAGAHAGQSAFHLLFSGVHALAARAGLIDAAQRTLDLQYYIVHEGLSTDYLLEKVLAAADRGVRVRFLMDDSTAWGKDAATAALSMHPNIEVRVFNSIGVGRGSAFGRTSALLLGVSRLHRRMHNKMLVADNAVAVVGGRNLADEYFGAASEVNFADLDLLIAGPITRQISASFDEYWNSSWAAPVESVGTVQVSDQDVSRMRAGLGRRLEKHRKNNPDYFAETERLSTGVKALQPEAPWIWATGHVVYDSPDKMGDTGSLQEPTHIGPRLRSLLEPLQSELVMMSAYFIPGDEGAAKLEELARRGVHVSVITNGLASTDVTAVFAAYAPYRLALAQSGVQLYEVRPDPAAREQAKKRKLAFGSSTASLHTKSIVFDGATAFVGSMNLDPRSQRWNTEVGVLVHSVELSQQILSVARIGMQPDNTYHVIAESDRLIWVYEDQGKAIRRTSEPASSWRSFKAHFMTWMLPQELL
jgi:cardiolipin synthase C